MDIVEGVRRLGFRKWYERRLIEAHAWLVTGFLLLILALALFEVRNDLTGGRERLSLLLAAVLALAGCILAWLRYHRILETTELAAEQANCPHCRAYGHLAVVRVDRPAAAADPMSKEELLHLTVRCRQCGGEWRLEPPA